MALPSKPFGATADFSSIKEFEVFAEQACKIAMKNTLQHFKKILFKYAENSVYNAYQPKWYTRTNWLKDDKAIETYIYKNTKDAIGGGVRFSKPTYDSYGDDREPFQHGNPYEYLEMGSYLEIMNGKTQEWNPFNFPVVKREPFYNKFLDILDSSKYGFDAVYQIYFANALSTLKTGKMKISKPPMPPDLDSSVPTSSGSLSSSTSQYSSYTTGNLAM